MAYTNSPLVTYTKLTSNHSGQRKHIIDTITIHCIVEQWTAKRLLCQHGQAVFGKLCRG